MICTILPGEKMVCLIVTIYSPVYAAITEVCTPAQQLILTNEDFLNAGISKVKIVLSGYGRAFYQGNAKEKTALLNLERAVLFSVHQFN